MKTLICEAYNYNTVNKGVTMDHIFLKLKEFYKTKDIDSYWWEKIKIIGEKFPPKNLKSPVIIGFLLKIVSF